MTRADTEVLIVGAGHGGLAVAHDLVRAFVRERVTRAWER